MQRPTGERLDWFKAHKDYRGTANVESRTFSSAGSHKKEVIFVPSGEVEL